MINITEKHYFNVATNCAGQRVLIVDNEYRHFTYEPVPFDAFDAIFFESEDYALLKRQVRSIITVDNSPNYSFKAFFIKPAITNKEALVFADGVCSSIDAPELIEQTRRIAERFVSMKFRVFDRDASFWTPERRIFHVLRTYLVRSDKYPEWEVQKLSALGYTIPRLEMLVKYKYASSKVMMQYLETLCDQYKLIEKRDLKAVIHICPNCYENRILLQEVCPKCGTIDIDEVHMIHHFRCANISSEESYLKDGKLICPKCRLELKHIGVDYDRPASMYYCKDNGIHFSTPNVKGLCAACHHTSDISELIKKRLYQTDYTALGLATFAQYDHVQDSDDIPKLPSIHPFNSFINAVRVRVSIARNNGNLYPVIFRLRVTPEDNLEMIDEVVINRIYKLHPNAVISYKNNTFYILQSFTHALTTENIDEFLPLKMFNKNNSGYNFDGDYIELDLDLKIDAIISLI